jgi:TatD DNase family protein
LEEEQVTHVASCVDSHAHLCHKAFRDDFQDVLARAQEKGVDLVINVAVDPETSRAAIERAEQNPHVPATVGMHPHEAVKMNERTLRELRSLAASPGVVAIGECGLDYYRMLSPRWSQEDCFRKCIRLAAHYNLPLIVHCRDAELEVLGILHEFRAGLGGCVVFHCFSSLPEYARRFVDQGCYLGFAGNVTYWDRERLRRALSQVPLDRMLLETDSPYLSPDPFRKERNEPANVLLTLERLAAGLQRPVQEVAALTTANAQHFFRLGPKGEE